ncbi:hypothetical protein KXD40_002340 [Peronospora effusa]|uniref:Uncharacterized protein n=1 Tax=Peronospora effusa TaxID=542832 RepID=A0A3M6VN84_9STRA|nr:hypothetical protein DD238_002840 [Peronospora effusa]UIZ26187.1 hypothetical protein KXD40_002340 [Peronospora effusa]
MTNSYIQYCGSSIADEGRVFELQKKPIHTPKKKVLWRMNLYWQASSGVLSEGLHSFKSPLG